MKSGNKELMIDLQTLKKSVRGKKVLIDGNIIIYLTEEIEPFSFLCAFAASRETFGKRT